MTKHLNTPIVPTVVDDERFSSNGMLPNAALMRRLADVFNFVAGKCKKQVFLKAQPLDAVQAGEPAQVFWGGYFRTGENTTSIRVCAGLGFTDYGFVTAPYMQLIVKNTVPTTVLSPKWTFAGSGGGSVITPAEIHYIQDNVTGLSTNTEYQWHVEQANGARLVFLSLTETDSRYADDTVTAVCNPALFPAEGPIYDAHIADLIEANNKLWRHNGAHLISWCSPGDPDDTTALTATSYTNAIDLSSTTITGATPGWNLQTRYHNTVNRTTIPVKMAIKSERASGVGTLDVKLTDGTNSITITGIGAGSPTTWQTSVAANIPAQNGTKWDLHAKVSSGSHRITGLSLFEYET